jgi:UDP-3-O-[3-hydroxymyristoyl] glucosamine N-acyltransferase
LRYRQAFSNGALELNGAVTRDDIEPGTTQLGAPCLPDKEQFRIMLATQRLPELVKRVTELEQKLAALEPVKKAA